MLGFLFTSPFITYLIITMFKDEITIDDIIEFIIKHCDDIELMDKINKTSFPFTTKYLNSNKWKATTPSTTITYPPYGGSTFTLCNGEEVLSPKE